MGIATSSTSQEIQNEMITDAANDCTTVTPTTNVTIITQGAYVQPPECPPDGGFILDQAANKDSLCLIDNLQSTAADYAIKLNSTAQAELGLSVTTDKIEMQNSINQSVENTCSGEANDSNYLIVNDVPVYSCNYVVTQNANSKNACIIKNTQSLMTNIANEVSNESTGSSALGLVFGDGWGGIILAIIVVVVFLIIAVVVVLAISSNKKKNMQLQQDQSFNDTVNEDLFEEVTGGSRKNPCFSWIIVVIILIVFVVILIMVYLNKRNGKNIWGKKLLQNKFNQSNLENFSQKVTDAYKIAGIDMMSDYQPISIETPKTSSVSQSSTDHDDMEMLNTNCYDELEQYYKSLLD